VGVREGTQLRGGGDPEPRLDRAGGVAHALRGVGDERLLLRGEAGVGAHAVEQKTALGEHQLDVDAGRHLDLGVVQPGRQRVAPRLHLERPGALGVSGDLGRVAVDLVGDLRHPHGRASYPVGVGQDDVTSELVVSFAEHQRGHGEDLAHTRLRGVAPVLDQRCHVHHRYASNHALTLAACAGEGKLRCQSLGAAPGRGTAGSEITHATAAVVTRPSGIANRRARTPIMSRAHAGRVATAAVAMHP
jgi:hypothetical protein